MTGDQLACFHHPEAFHTGNLDLSLDPNTKYIGISHLVVRVAVGALALVWAFAPCCFCFGVVSILRFLIDKAISNSFRNLLWMLKMKARGLEERTSGKQKSLNQQMLQEC